MIFFLNNCCECSMHPPSSNPTGSNRWTLYNPSWKKIAFLLLLCSCYPVKNFLADIAFRIGPIPTLGHLYCVEWGVRLYSLTIGNLDCVNLIECSILIEVSDGVHSMWNRRMLCTNMKLSSGCSQLVTLLTWGKVNFSRSMSSPITRYANCAKQL